MKVRILILFLFASCFAQAQTDTLIIRGEPFYNAQPEMYLIIDTVKLQLDSISVKRLEPKWIKKIEVIKSQEYKLVYGNTDGVIFIYPKRRHRKRIIKLYEYE